MKERFSDSVKLYSFHMKMQPLKAGKRTPSTGILMLREKQTLSNLVSPTISRRCVHVRDATTEPIFIVITGIAVSIRKIGAFRICRRIFAIIMLHRSVSADTGDGVGMKKLLRMTDIVIPP